MFFQQKTLDNIYIYIYIIVCMAFAQRVKHHTFFIFGGTHHAYYS